MKTCVWVVGMGMLGLVACGRSSTEDPGNMASPSTQAEAVRAVAADNCDHYASCGEVAPGKGYSDRASCLMARERFWSDKWPAERCDGHLEATRLQACRDGIRDIDCKSLVDEFRTLNSVCDPARVCGAP